MANSYSSSTGGFTDYALQHGATKVIAVDVGTNQLHSSLRGNERVELHEKTDIRNFRTDEMIDVCKTKLGKYLILPDICSDKPELLSITFLFALPSCRERYASNHFWEAMMMKLPVVANDLRDSREEVNH